MRSYIPSQGTSDEASLNIPGLVPLMDEFDLLETTDTASGTASAYSSYLYARQNITTQEEIGIQNFPAGRYITLFNKPIRLTPSYATSANVITYNLKETVDALRDETVKEQTTEILRLLEENISVFSSLPIPLFYVTELEDESVLIEWIVAPFRLSFNVEKDKKESGYVLISDKLAGEIRSLGRLEGLDPDSLIKSLLILILGNLKVGYA